MARTAAHSQNRKCREISNPEADLQLIAPPANQELFKSRFETARKTNVQLNRALQLKEEPLPSG